MVHSARVFAFCAVVCAFCGCGRTEQQPASVEQHAPVGTSWSTDVDGTLAAARRANRPSVLLFYAEWAIASLQLRRDVLASDEFKKRFGGRFGLAEFDATDESAAGTKAVLKQFDVQALPTLIIVDRKGAEVRRVTEFVEMAALAPALEEAVAR